MLLFFHATFEQKIWILYITKIRGIYPTNKKSRWIHIFRKQCNSREDFDTVLVKGTLLTWEQIFGFKRLLYVQR